MEHRRREPAPGVFRLTLPLPFPGLDRVNAYLLADGDRATLVDVGIHDPQPEAEHGWGHLVAVLEACDVRVEAVDRVIVTHHHVDHYGMAGKIVEKTGCDLLMHAEAGRDLRAYTDPDATAGSLRELLSEHGVPDAELSRLTAFEDWRAFVHSVVEPSVPVHDGDRIDIGPRRWEVVHTPGHARSHICLWSPRDGLFISGDHLLPTVTPHIDVGPGGDADPLGSYLASLARVEELSPRLVLPGHGRPFDDGAARARVIARHHDRRLGSILQVIRREARSADEITDEVFSSTLLHFHRRLALGEVLAHLAYLRSRGEVERVDRGDGTAAYKKTPRREAS